MSIRLAVSERAFVGAHQAESRAPASQRVSTESRTWCRRFDKLIVGHTKACLAYDSKAILGGQIAPDGWMDGAGLVFVARSKHFASSRGGPSEEAFEFNFVRELVS